MQGPSTVKTHADSTGQAPPPYSQLPIVDCIEANCVNSSEALLSKLLDNRNVFQIAPETAIGCQVHDGNGTLLLLILMQPLSDKDCWIRNVFLNATGRQVMEMRSISEGEDNNTWIICAGGRVVGILMYFDGKSELVGYRISGEEMFRTVEDGPHSWAVRKNGRDLAVIAQGDSPYTTAFAIYNEEEEFEVKALLVCSAIYFDSVHLKGYNESARASETLPKTRTGTVYTNTKWTSCLICCSNNMGWITLILIVLLVFMFFKGLIDLFK